MEIHEVTRGNCYAPAWGMLVMMMMVKLGRLPQRHNWLWRNKLTTTALFLHWMESHDL